MDTLIQGQGPVIFLGSHIYNFKLHIISIRDSINLKGLYDVIQNKRELWWS